MSSQVPPNPLVTKLQKKIGWICHSIRWMLIIWLGWILAIIVTSFIGADATVAKLNAFDAFKDYPVTAHSYVSSLWVHLFSWLCATPIGFAGWQLTKFYLTGDILSEAAALRMKRLGQVAIFATVVGIAMRPISAWLLSAGHFNSMQVWNFFAPQDLLNLLFGTFIFSIAHIYHAAAEINAENKGFI